MEGLNGELALVQFPSSVLSAQTSTTSLYSPNPDLKISGTIYTTDMEYFTSTPLPFTTILTQSHDSIWASPGWSEIFTSTANTFPAFKDSSQIVVISTNMVSATEDPSLGPTARTVERSLRSSNRKLFPTTSSSEQISQSVHPIQVAQTEDDALMIGGVGIIETLVSSEISSSVITLTAFKTIVLTTVSTSMICTLPSITLSPTTLMTISRSTFSAFDSSSPTTYLSTFSSNSITKSLTTQLSTFSSPLSTSTAAISTSSDISSTSTLATSTIQLPVVPSASTSSIATSIINSQPSVTPINPPADPVCNASPGGSYMDVHGSDVNGHIATFCGKDFGQDCPAKGYAFKEDMDTVINVVGYNISINPIPFCSVLSTSTCEFPLPNRDFNCSSNLWTAWRNCWHNHGMGGSVSAGCLVYNLTPLAISEYRLNARRAYTPQATQSDRHPMAAQPFPQQKKKKKRNQQTRQQ